MQEWVEGEDLRAVMKQHRQGATNKLAGFIGEHIAQGLQYLHAQGTVHLNVSPGNIIINSSRTSLKLRDYGLRTFKVGWTNCLLLSILSSNLTFVLQFANFADAPSHGNPRYAAVEVFMRQHDAIGPASDVWSWAMVMWEVATGSPVFSDYRPPQVSRKVWEAGDRPDLEDVTDPNLARVLAKCWSKSPTARPGVSELISAARDLASSGKLAPREAKPGLFQPQNNSGSAAPAKSSQSADDASLDAMLGDLDKLL